MNLGVFCLPMASHVNLFLALARTLRDRGHRLTFFGISVNEAKIRAAGFGFQSVEPDTVPAGTLGHIMHRMAALGGLGSMRLQGRFDQIRYEGILTKGLTLVREARLDSVLVDQADPCSGSVAQAVGLPWISVCNGLCLNGEPAVPPFFTSWPYSRNPWAVARNRLAYGGIRIASLSIQNQINRFRKLWNLPLLRRFDETFSPFAQISQQPREFDFPRETLPETFHYVGPLRYPEATSISFPWHRLNGQPLVYGSLGTVVNGTRDLYRAIAEACAPLDVQLVLSLGDENRQHECLSLPGSPIVVPFAPQVELLGRAALTVTHAGLNTTLESLGQGVPLVAIPIAFEQPGIAARIEWTGTGRFLPASRVTPRRLRTEIETVLRGPSYRQAAERMKVWLEQSGGSARAAAIIEEVSRTGKPVGATVERSKAAASLT